jgi:hypothetical protein
MSLSGLLGTNVPKKLAEQTKNVPYVGDQLARSVEKLGTALNPPGTVADYLVSSAEEALIHKHREMCANLSIIETRVPAQVFELTESRC